jgi:hypothetical protein
VKKKIADKITENHKQSPESGRDQLKQSASSSTTKERYDTVGAMKECEKVVRNYPKAKSHANQCHLGSSSRKCVSGYIDG